MRLSSAVQRFRDAYHARADLVRSMRGWTKTIALAATDSAESVIVQLHDGAVAGWSEGGDGDVVISADLATLCDVLELKRGPNEPYLFGELVVRGPEEDFLKLDYVTSVLAPA